MRDGRMAEEIVRLARDGFTVKQIAEQLGVCIDYSYRVLRKAGIKAKRGYKTGSSADTAVLSMRHLSAMDIARKTGLAVSTVYHAANALGIKLPKKSDEREGTPVTVEFFGRQFDFTFVRQYRLFGEDVATIRGLTGKHQGVPLSKIRWK